MTKRQLLRAHARALQYWWARWQQSRDMTALCAVERVLDSARASLSPAEYRALALAGSRVLSGE